MSARRPTRQRAALARALEGSTQFSSAQELHARLRNEDTTVGLATVYRNLQAMASEGELDVIRTPEGEALYRACSTHHHHHLVCRVCGKAVEVTGAGVEAWAERVSAEHGFSSVQHTVEIVGTCSDCS
jgi:Fur family ferric uptake transcriptional regulator